MACIKRAALPLGEACSAPSVLQAERPHRSARAAACRWLYRDQCSGWVAERQGFEPWVLVRAQRFSRPPRSTTPASLRNPIAPLKSRWLVVGSAPVSAASSPCQDLMAHKMRAYLRRSRAYRLFCGCEGPYFASHEARRVLLQSSRTHNRCSASGAQPLWNWRCGAPPPVRFSRRCV